MAKRHHAVGRMGFRGLNVHSAAGRRPIAEVMEGRVLLSGDWAATKVMALPNPTSVAAVGNRLFFDNYDATHGTELWVSDGTAAGTHLVKDINPAGSSSPKNMIALGGTLLFWANDGVHGSELWRTDGTDGGTSMVLDVNTGSASSQDTDLPVVLGDYVYFPAVAYSVAEGLYNVPQLWRTDGTAAGTTLVKDDCPAKALAAVNGKLFFASDQYNYAGSYRPFLWVYDPALGITQMLNDGYNGGYFFGNHPAVANGLYLTSRNGALWVSDGTAVGTKSVGGAAANDNLIAVGNSVYYRGTDSANGAELWVSDGSALGTRLVKDIRTGTGNSNPNYLTACGDGIFFTAYDDYAKTTCWYSDGTVSGTLSLGTTISSSSPVPMGRTVVFTANDAYNGTELWMSDGTVAGTGLACDVCPGVQSSSPSFYTPVGDRLFVWGNDSGGTRNLWVCQTAQATTTALACSPNPVSYGSGVTATVTVAAGTGTPTGSISILDGGMDILGAGGLLGPSGTSSVQVTNLAAGTHSLTARYAGDGTFAGSLSSSITLVVNKATTATSLTSSMNPSTPGDNVTFTATVASVASGASGTVTFLCGATVLGSAAVGSGGTATFATASLPEGSNSITASYGGDANFAGSTSSALSQVVNAGTGGSVTFSGTDLPVGAGPTYVMAQDLNGDNKADLIVSRNTGDVEVLLGNGDGTFRTAVAYKTGNCAYSVATGDFNGDTKPDLAIPEEANAKVSVRLGNGDGTFQTATSSATAGYKTNGVLAGDFNVDGKTDLIVTNYSSNNLGVLLGKGDGTFQTAVAYPTGSGPGYVATGDFNGDGKADLVVDNNGASNVSVLLGKGDGTFQTAVNYSTGSGPYGPVIYDFDGDGKKDLVVPNNGSGNVSVLLGNGNGTFQTAVNYVTGTNATSVAIGDFDGDGKVDLAVANGNAGIVGNVTVLLGNGNGTFQPVVVVATGGHPYMLAACDFNGDSKVDLAAANSDGTVRVLLNTSTSVIPTNHPPTDIGLSSTSVAEGQPVGTAVGTLSATDPDAGDTFTYSLVAGTGSSDNGSFSIVGNALKTASSFVYATKNSYSIRLRVSDQGGLTYDKAFIISVTQSSGNFQTVSGSGTLAGVSGSSISVPISYSNSAGDTTLTGLGLRIHFDSSKVAWNAPSNVLGTPTLPPGVPVDDTSNLDGNAATNKYVLVAWADINGNWPNVSLPALLLNANLALSSQPDGTQTTVGFSASSTAVGYGFQGTAVTITWSSFSFDIDGNGSADALTDGILVLRYLFGQRTDPQLTQGAIGTGATRTTASQIVSYLDSAGTRRDIDGNGSVDALTDGILLLRYLFGQRTDPQLTQGAIGAGATRTTAAQIVSYLGGMMPSGAAMVPAKNSASSAMAAQVYAAPATNTAFINRPNLAESSVAETSVLDDGVLHGVLWR